MTKEGHQGSKVEIDGGRGKSGCDKYQAEKNKRDEEEPSFNKSLEDAKKKLPVYHTDCYRYGLVDTGTGLEPICKMKCDANKPANESTNIALYDEHGGCGDCKNYKKRLNDD